ncbi:Asp-tRNA(Asn)/Glu-tRNA(Gln) amidotransferase subunit GatC [Lacticaseibacillus zhaodongensis]|uniref:Asp-tRNA(Asn)/Glu-tRNA(Gln) amidotransferase subunit GatC n=1 Tax=Lacticaseibacillus zhaodongensis TaxID=2668065 RepID=UPI0012D2F436|nr:Asp-tRNA(Asn)/Glu-tRNA(Gln) amidotransferase subunit GatC [Lacticaseibacillus zhaodongensis]
MISKEQVAHVAELARLQFSDEKLQEFTGQLDEIMNMVDQLSEVDTDGVPVTTQSVLLENVLRDDVAEKPTSRTTLMKNVPTAKAGLIQVPTIIDKEDD